MAQLIGSGGSRLSDSTYIDEVDDGIQGLEEDLSQIFGVPLNTTITSPIFRYYDSASVSGVESDGTINGEMVFKRDVISGASNSPGPIFWNQGNAKKWKICPIGDHLGLYLYDFVNDVWDSVLNLDESSVAKLTELEDVAEPSGGYGISHAEKILALDSTGLECEWVDRAAGGGVSALPDLSDVNNYNPAAMPDWALCVNPAGGTYWKDLAAGGAATLYTQLGDTYPSDVLNAGDVGSAIEVGYDPTNDIKLQMSSPAFGTTKNDDFYVDPNPDPPSSPSGASGFTIPPSATRYITFKSQATGFSTVDFWRHHVGASYYHLNFFRDGLYQVVFSGSLTNVTSEVRFWLLQENFSKVLIMGGAPPSNRISVGSAQVAFQFFSISWTVAVQDIGKIYTSTPTSVDGVARLAVYNSQGTSINITSVAMSVVRVGNVKS